MAYANGFDLKRLGDKIYLLEKENVELKKRLKAVQPSKKRLATELASAKAKLVELRRLLN